MEICHIFHLIFSLVVSKVVCCRLVVSGKGLTDIQNFLSIAPLPWNFRWIPWQIYIMYWLCCFFLSSSGKFLRKNTIFKTNHNDLGIFCLFIWQIFSFWKSLKMVKKSINKITEALNPFPHTAILQQTTLERILSKNRKSP